MSSRESEIGIPERTYHGIIPPQGYRTVTIKEADIRDALLFGLDGSPDLNWGYGGGGPHRFAQALSEDAFDNDIYGEAFACTVENRLVKRLNQNEGFVLSRDRVVLEGMLSFKEFVAISKTGGYFIEPIRELVKKCDETRERLFNLLSKNFLKNLQKSGFGM